MFRTHGARRLLGSLFFVAMPLIVAPCHAQNNGNGGNNGGNGGNNGGNGNNGSTNSTTTIVRAGSAVGGVSIDARGALGNVELDRGRLRDAHHAAQASAGSSDLDKPSARRCVSLRKLEAFLDDHLRSGEPLPEEALLLAGLQRLQYVFVYPDQQDIVLVGYAEGWDLDPRGSYVGRTTGHPVMQLDDLLVALRAAVASPSVISCSIDPTPEGLGHLQQFVKHQRTIGNPQQTIAAIEHALGPQTITVQGVPASSHLARVLVAADYRMKRLAMDFDPAPVHGLPSFMELLTHGGGHPTNMLPRWWLAPNYASMLRDAEGQAFELRGAGVKCLTEEDYATTSGERSHSGHASPQAAKWAQTMTDKYSELADAEPVFGELLNVMDLAIFGALFVEERLPAKAGHDFALLTGEQPLRTAELHAPTHVDSKATVRKHGRDWLISASGGVQFNAFEIVEKAETSPEVDAARDGAAPRGERWWWDSAP